MFGYISPDRPYLFIKDEVLYKAMYCGLCMGIKKGCGNMARTALTYDLTFLSALLHNIKNQDVKIEKRRCFLHPIKKRPMAEADELTVLLGYINTVLAYFKLCDDKEDGEISGILRFLYKKGYKKTAIKHPKIVEIISAQTRAQRELESAGCSIIEQAAEPTAVMMSELSKYILQEFATEHTSMLFYDLGKWVYLADALDDYDKDVKKGNYNVLYNVFKRQTKAQAVKSGEEELKFIFNTLFADMNMRLANIKFYFNHDLTDNIILRGIPLKTRTLFYGKCGEGKKEVKNEQA